jgi:hypothetical protein
MYKQEEGVRPPVIITAISLFALTVAADLSIPAEAISSSYGMAVVHVVPHGTSCKSLPPLDRCNFNTSYIGTGDIDIIPVFFELDYYTVVEFGLSWPADWGTCSFMSCGSGTVLGNISNPGDGIVKMWQTCQVDWSVPVGYGWLAAQSPGRVTFTESPWVLGDRIGVTDCAQKFSTLRGTFAAGVGWIQGDEPCIGPEPLYLEISDDASGSCVPTGDTLNCSIHIYNGNMFAIHDVVLVDSLPPGTVYLSGGTYDQQTRIMRLDLGTIQPGEAWKSFALRITAPAGAIVTNHFAVMTREFWPKPATHTKQVCSGPVGVEPTTWGSIKALLR